MNTGAPLKSKLLRNLGANAYGQAITVAVQLLSMPIFLHYWGVALYGEWLILSSVPAYLAISDIGFASVGANDMTMRVANGDRRGALEVYQSIWLFISLVSVLLGGALGLLIYVVPVHVQFDFALISGAETRQLINILMLYVLVGLQGGVLNAAFRAVGKYAYGNMLGNTIRLAEWAASLVGLLMGGGVLVVGMLMLATRMFGLVLTWLVLKKQERWLSLGTEAASMQQVRHLLKPAVAFMAFPLGLAISLQGMVLIIGITLGSVAVVVFTAYRSLTRLLVQVITMINQAVWPEMSAAYGAKQMDLARQLHRKCTNITIWVAVTTVTLLAVIGEWFVGMWTGHAFEQNHVLFGLLLATTFINVLWQTSWVVLMATNQHQRIASAFLVSATSGLLLSAVVIPSFGVSGAALILCLVELPLLFIAISSALQLLNDDWSGYLKSVLSRPTIPPI